MQSPNMDKVLKSRLSAQTKTEDKQLARTQALLLDAVGPLSFILEEARKGQLPPKATVEAAQTALRLLGNVSANISRERRRAAIANMNYRLVDMAEDDQLFAKAAPILFGDGFANKAKERDEELKCLNHASLQGRDHRKTGLDDRKFFQTSPSSFQPQGSSTNYSRGRGRGSGAFHPHHPYKVQGPPRNEQKKNQ